jgi:putative ABC transport system permease protein
MSRTLARAVVRLAGVLVPPSYRDRFVDEWCAEIVHEVDPWRALGRSLGAVRDAMATRRIVTSTSARPMRSRRRANSMVFQDIRFAVRSFLHRPGWTVVVLLTLAVGIGANTAIFSLFNAVVLRPLDYPESDRLVKILGSDLETGETRNISPADFYDFQSESESFESMGAHGWVGFFTITGDGDPERVAGTQVTAGFFTTLGVSPRLGRTFTLEDDREGVASTTLLTHAFWQRRFGGDPDVVGKSLEVNALVHEIIGVLPPSFRHPEPNPEREPELYTLYQFERGGAFRSGRFIRGIGRLSAGRSLDAARAELDGLARRLEQTYPESNKNRGVHLLTLKDAVVGEARTGVLVLLGAVIAVLLIACANIANLQLASGGARRHELAIKAALGAGRGRLVRQLVTESLVLAFIGGALGVVLAYWVRGFLMLRAVPRAEELDFSLPVLGFAFAAATIAAILFGLAPALALSSGDLRRESKRSRPRQLLVMGEVAVSMVLLVIAGLLIKSLSELRSVAPGFEPERVLTMQVSLPTARYEEGEQIPFYHALHEKVAAISGVGAAGAINILPLSQNYSSDGFQIDVRPAPEGESPSAEARSVANDYFQVMGIPLLRGRLFDGRERVDSPGVVVISDAMAKRFWPGEDPIGQRMTYNRGLPEETSQDVGGAGSREIVGIVGDVKHLGLDDSDVAMFYVPHSQQPSFHTMTLVLRTSADPDVIAGAIRAELSSMDPNIPLYAVRALDTIVEQTIDAPRFRTQMLGIFAAVALVVAVIGVYAVTGVSLVQRTKEIGIRMALGAAAPNLIKIIVAQSMKPVAWGLALGLAAALVVTRFLVSLLFNVSAMDITVYVAVAGMLALTALAAAIVPTLRALRIDPVRTLRTE